MNFREIELLLVKSNIEIYYDLNGKRLFYYSDKCVWKILCEEVHLYILFSYTEISPLKGSVREKWKGV